MNNKWKPGQRLHHAHKGYGYIQRVGDRGNQSWIIHYTDANGKLRVNRADWQGRNGWHLPNSTSPQCTCPVCNPENYAKALGRSHNGRVYINRRWVNI